MLANMFFPMMSYILVPNIVENRGTYLVLVSDASKLFISCVLTQKTRIGAYWFGYIVLSFYKIHRELHNY